MSLDALLADLRKEYLAGIPSRIEEIQTHWKNGEHERLRDAFHRLKGTGKTYGIPDLSRIAEAAEKICSDKTENIGAAVRLAVELIATVHGKAGLQESFDATQDPRFSELQKLV